MAGEHGSAAGHGLQHRQAKALPEAGIHQGQRPLVELHQGFEGHIGPQLHAGLQPPLTHEGLQARGFRGMGLARQHQLQVGVLGGQRRKRLDQTKQVFVGVGLTHMQQIGALAGQSDGPNGGAEAGGVVAQGDHADALGGHPGPALDLPRREGGIGEDVAALPQQRWHPSAEVQRLQGALGVADGPQVVHHHHLGSGLAPEVALGGRGEDQRGTVLARQARQPPLAPQQAPQPLAAATGVAARDQHMGQLLQSRQHALGIDPNARGLAQHRPVIEKQGHQARPISRRRPYFAQFRAQQRPP